MRHPTRLHAFLLLALATALAMPVQAREVEYYAGNRGASGPLAASGTPRDKPAAARPIDINTASEEELAALPGIGPMRARSIVRNRPYTRKDELVRRKVIPKAVYEAIRERVVARR